MELNDREHLAVIKCKYNQASKHVMERYRGSPTACAQCIRCHVSAVATCSEDELAVAHNRPQLLNNSLLFATLGMANSKVEAAFERRVPVSRVC
jgi:hypothetical protein